MKSRGVPGGPGLEGDVALVVEYESAQVGDDGATTGQEASEGQVFATILDRVLERLRNQPMAHSRTGRG